MTRVVADTNILISGILFGGLLSRLLDHAAKGHLELVTSPILLDELEQKFLTKFKLSLAESDFHRFTLEELCDVVSTTPHLAVVIADPDDDRVLECALAGHADFIVTGDHHLLDLKSFQDIPILTARQLTDRLLAT